MEQGTSKVTLEKDGTFHVHRLVFGFLVISLSFLNPRGSAITGSDAKCSFIRGQGRVSQDYRLFCLSKDVALVSHCVYGAWNGKNGRYITFEPDDVIE